MLHTKIIDTKDSKLSIQKAENFIFLILLIQINIMLAIVFTMI